MRHESLTREVIGVEIEVAFRDLARVARLSRWHAPQLRNVKLDRESPAWQKVFACVCEARDLL